MSCSHIRNIRVRITVETNKGERNQELWLGHDEDCDFDESSRQFATRVLWTIVDLVEGMIS